MQYIIRPDSTTAGDADWTETGAASDHAAVNEAQDDYTTYTDFSNAVANSKIRFGVGDLPTQGMVVTQVTITAYLGSSNPGGGRDAHFVLRSGGADYSGSTFTIAAGSAEYSATWTTDPATSLPWTKAGVNAIEVGLETELNGGRTDNARIYRLKVVVDYAPVAAATEQSRDAASRELRVTSQPPPEIEIETPLHVGLDVDVGEKLALTHFAFPSADGNGAGRKRWQRLDTIVLEREPRDESVRLRLLCARRLRFLYWDTAYTDVDSMEWENGVARATTGQTMTYSRASKAYVIDPGSGLLVRKENDLKKIDDSGWLFERARTNLLLNSSFQSGNLTGWTPTNAAADADGTFAASDLSGYRCTLTYSGAAASIVQSGGALNAISGRHSFSIDHYDTTGHALKIRVQRSSDSKYYRASDQTWQAAATDNSLTVRSSAIAQDVIANIDLGAGPENVTLSVIADTATQVARLFHVQFEAGRWPSSRIVTTTVATATRAIDAYTLSNNSGRRAINAQRFTWCCQIMPLWNSADLGSESMYLFDVAYDGNNRIALGYAGASGAWNLSVKAAGATVTATKTAAVTRGTLYTIAGRLTGVDAELDLAAYTASIFVDGVKGTDAISAAVPTEANGNLYVATDTGGTEAADGYLRHILSTQNVMTDEEIARYPLQ